jgi:activator of 2-hydroxyglutaryl-CoA dehydratase
LHDVRRLPPAERSGGTMKSLGINIGSSSLKLAVLEDGRIIQSLIRDHEGDFRRTLTTTLAEQGIEPGIPTIATGTEGRFLLNTPNVMETICMEEALAALGEKVDALVSLGGENFVVYTIDDAGKIITSFAGNKCASGTGEFFKQQLGRMDMRLEDVAKVGPEAKVQSLSSRCSVFMKSDCTHKLNKGEATKDDIVVSLSNVMAMKVVDFLKEA